MAVTHGGAIFQAARELGCDWREVVDFSASINPLGPSPSVAPAIIAALDQIAHYPDPYASLLQMALSESWEVEPERILLGNGVTDLIHFLARIWPVEVTLIPPLFSEFHRAYPTAQLNQWPEEGVVITSNPVNPTGAPGCFHERRGLTIIDESFIEFTSLPTRMHAEGCIVFQSLTKFHALPGLRVGALIGPGDLIRQWRAKREPWQVNVLAQAAALAAISDKGHQLATLEFVRSERARIMEAWEELPGVRLHPTHANYFMASLDYSAERLCAFLYHRRLLLRNCTGTPGVEGQAVRFAIRSRAENDRLLESWMEFPCD